MLRVITENGVRLGEPETGSSTRAAVRCHGEGVAAKLGDGCNVELIAITITSLMDSLVRCGAIRGEQMEAAITDLSNCYEGIAQGAPAELLECEEFKCFKQRLEASAILLREHVEDVMGVGA